MALCSACVSTQPRGGPTVRIALQELVSADLSPTGLATSKIREVVQLDLEGYVTRVLAGEVPADWPAEALKAQAIASRSYALYLKAHARSPDYDILSSVNDQVFLPQGKIAESHRDAVRATTGKALFASGEPMQAFFHSCCGGTTERPADVWPTAHNHPLQVSVNDPYDTECPNYRWNYELSKVELLVLLSEGGHDIADFTDIVPRSLTSSGRIRAFRFVGPRTHADIDSNELRRVIGYSELKSTNFRMKEEDMNILIEGNGSGHGVGLCQWGARGMALAGFTAEQILDHFYPGAELTTAY